MFRYLEQALKQIKLPTSIPSQSTATLLFLKSNDGTSYMVDSGSQPNLIPYDSSIDVKSTVPFKLYAANEQPIATYGYRDVTFTIDDSTFTVQFVTGETKCPLLGRDFLNQYQIIIIPFLNLLFSSHHRKLFRCQTAYSSTVNLHIDPKKQIQQLLEQFPELIKEGNQLRKVQHNTVHYINTTGPPVCTRYSQHFNPDVQKAVEDYFYDLIERGICVRSNSQYSSPLAIVMKRNGKLRPCGDFRGINEQTIPDRYPLPHMPSFNNRVHGSHFFTVLDLKSAYHQIPMYGPHAHKTSVHTPLGLLMFLRMPFGLKCASQTFQRFMDEITDACRQFTYTFIDDLLIHSHSIVEHYQHLLTVFGVLDKHGLTINLNKSQLCESAVTYLGYKVDSIGITPDSKRVEAIRRYPTPTTPAHLRRFLGMVNFYIRFIPNSQQYLHELYSLYPRQKTAFNRPIELSPRHLELIEQLKQGLINATHLHHPKSNAVLILETDASDSGYGSVLHQLVNGQLQPIYFHSASFSTHQMYNADHIYFKELTAVYQSVKKMHKLLIGRHVLLYSDNQALINALRNPKEKPPSEIKKLIHISQFIEEYHYIQSKDNVVADALSRCNNVYYGSKINYHQLVAAQSAPDEWTSTLTNANNYQRVMRQFDNMSCMVWIYVDLQLNKLICVPKSCVRMVFDAYHSLHHSGYKSTLRLIGTRFYWPSMKSDIKQLVKSCERCARSKPSLFNFSPVRQIPVNDSRFAHLHIDAIGPMPISPAPHRYMYAITILDRFTRYLIAVPVSNLESTTIIHTLEHSFIKYFGIPQILVHDGAAYFKSVLFQRFCSSLGIKAACILPYHPQSDGILERSHLKLKSSIRAIGEHWWIGLPYIMLGWNNSVTEDNCYSPSQMVYGTESRLPADLFKFNLNNLVQGWSQDQIRVFIKVMNDLVPVATSNHQSPTKRLFRYQGMDNCVSVFVKNDARGSKLDSLWTGPHRVLRRDESYFLVERNGQPWSVHISKLKPAYEINL
jgi:transposase InsO family protein